MRVRVESANPVVRGIALEVHRDGSMCLAIRSPHARYALGVRHRPRRGGTSRVWWLLEPDGTATNANFEAGSDRASALATALCRMLDACEADARAAELADVGASVPARIARLEREMAALRSYTENLYSEGGAAPSVVERPTA
jgi:hypothetical protein